MLLMLAVADSSGPVLVLLGAGLSAVRVQCVGLAPRCDSGVEAVAEAESGAKQLRLRKGVREALREHSRAALVVHVDERLEQRGVPARRGVRLGAVVFGATVVLGAVVLGATVGLGAVGLGSVGLGAVVLGAVVLGAVGLGAADSG